ncbi:MAG TPA: hypothetical protein VEC06_21040 [Paucimonas sp.]|nr:hypothetical protein [Paucimonas sp.]
MSRMHAFTPRADSPERRLQLGDKYRNGVPATGLMLLAVVTVIVQFAWVGRAGFNLWDEGFLWYGAQRVMLGEVPIRDFMAYDPGRYYWSAVLMSLAGDNGILSLRAAIAVFQVMGMFLALLMVSRASRRPDFLLIAIAVGVFVLWMYPRHKLFDITLSIVLVGALMYVAERPSVRRCFLAGVVVGLVAFFGRNHGFYGAVGSAAALSYFIYVEREIDSPVSTFGWWIVGIGVGYVPLILMLALIPGFAEAFIESVRFLFEVKATNLPLPVPWPWSASFDKLSWLESLRGILIGSFFIAVLAFGVIGLIFLFGVGRRGDRPSPIVTASIFMALPYAHYAFSRADVDHLAQGIFPFLIGMFGLFSKSEVRFRNIFALALLVASALVMLPLHSSRQMAVKDWVEATVGKDRLKVEPAVFKDLALLERLSNVYSPERQTFIAAPFWPGAYAVLERKAPMWEIYALFPRSAEFQLAEIERIKRADPKWAIIMDIPLDGRDDLRFKNTHPILDKYIRDNFLPVSGMSTTNSLRIYESRKSVE